MNPRLLYILSGYLSLLMGAGAVMCTFRFFKYALVFAMLGFISATINIFLNTRYYFDEVKFPKGYLGMFLSSVPVLFFFFIKVQMGRH